MWKIEINSGKSEYGFRDFELQNVFEEDTSKILTTEECPWRSKNLKFHYGVPKDWCMEKNLRNEYYSARESFLL